MRQLYLRPLLDFEVLVRDSEVFPTLGSLGDFEDLSLRPLLDFEALPDLVVFPTLGSLVEDLFSGALVLFECEEASFGEKFLRLVLALLVRLVLFGTSITTAIWGDFDELTASLGSLEDFTRLSTLETFEDFGAFVDLLLFFGNLLDLGFLGAFDDTAIPGSLVDLGPLLDFDSVDGNTMMTGSVAGSLLDLGTLLDLGALLDLLGALLDLGVLLDLPGALLDLGFALDLGALLDFGSELLLGLFGFLVDLDTWFVTTNPSVVILFNSFLSPWEILPF